MKQLDIRKFTILIKFSYSATTIIHENQVSKQWSYWWAKFCTHIRIQCTFIFNIDSGPKVGKEGVRGISGEWVCEDEVVEASRSFLWGYISSPLSPLRRCEAFFWTNDSRNCSGVEERGECYLFSKSYFSITCNIQWYLERLNDCFRELDFSDARNVSMVILANLNFLRNVSTTETRL